jgi:acetolactate synthase-1/2/3 large subunit
MKVSDIFAEFCKHNGIDTLFGIIGSANAHLFDSCSKYNIKIVNMHHEQAVVMAAGAYFRASGKLTCALVTAGGGATNALTGLIGAWADSIPIIIISGQESTGYIRAHSMRRMYGTQGVDIMSMVAKHTKYSKIVYQDFQKELERAYTSALSGRFGPVWLDIPFNVQSSDECIREWNINKAQTEYCTFDTTEFKNANKPIILAGHGIKLSNAQEDFNSLLDNIKCPILSSWSGIDIVDHRYDLYCGSPGIYGQRAANFIIQESDYILAIGTRLTLPQTGYDTSFFAPNAKIVMVDIDDTECKDFATHIRSDCKEFLKCLKVI